MPESMISLFTLNERLKLCSSLYWILQGAAVVTEWMP